MNKTHISQTMVPMRIVASGICCAVGYHAEAASCALRASMDHFTESDFVTNDGTPLRVAKLLNENIWGIERTLLWTRYAISECLEKIPREEYEQIPIILLTRNDFRVNNGLLPSKIFQLLSNRLEVKISSKSKLFFGNKADIAQALNAAKILLTEDNVQKVILAGADSYLAAPLISYYLSEDRLLTPGNRDGFIPGEAAAAIVLELSQKKDKSLYTYICAIGHDYELGRPDGSVPSRAQGLSRAIRHAMQAANINANALDFRISDQNGEAFFAKEAANAVTRIAEPGDTIPQVLTTADCTGEIGAATAPLMLAWLHRWLPAPDNPGLCGLIHLANDTGERTALIIKYEH